MAKDKETNGQDDQYNYSEEQYTSEEVYPVKNKVNVGATVGKVVSSRKRLFIILAAALLVYILFKIFNAIEHHGDLTTPTKPPINNTMPVKHPTNINTTATQPILPMNNMANNNSTPTNNSGVNNQQVQNMQDNLAKMQNNMYNIQNQLGALDKSLTQIQNLLSQQLYMMRLQQMRSIQQERSQMPAYQVYAVIPNRAWLLGPKGNTTTVRVGSVIPGLGMVIEIDPVQGTVSTNKGVTLKYAIDDT